MPREVTKLARWAIIVSGSRDWTQSEPIRARLSGYPADTLVLHGAAGGADSLASWCAKRQDLIPVPHPYFKELGMSGGPARNGLLVALLSAYRDYGYQCAVEAFMLTGLENKGTKNLCERAERAGFGDVTTITWGNP